MAAPLNDWTANTVIEVIVESQVMYVKRKFVVQQWFLIATVINQEQGMIDTWGAWQEKCFARFKRHSPVKHILWQRGITGQ